MNLSKKTEIKVIGGGLAGVEAANQITKFGTKVTLYEMKPKRFSPAHKSQDLAELVCSNSLKSNSIQNASGILKEEMKMLDSLVLEAAAYSSVPAGKALAVDRNRFSEYITGKIEDNEKINIVREELSEIDIKDGAVTIISTGPLTSESLTKEILKITKSENLYFYDSISPIINADSIDYSKTFRASRYENESSGEGDYINCPLDKDLYESLVREIINGEKIETHEFENTGYFESCMPVEVICERGVDTLRFGPMKPVGLVDPNTGKNPYAVLQLRTENREESMYNMVGFQTKLKYPEQKRVFRMIPGLENAEFFRYGSIHRNTYINSPTLLNRFLQLKDNGNLFFAGQITGVEGYVESAAMGILAGINSVRVLNGKDLIPLPAETSLGSLLTYITDADRSNFQPMNINFGLYPVIEGKFNKAKKRELIAERAIEKISEYKSKIYG
ncbi:MAG: methylenetetrahydrofolate--tRNA-(uracil(54)-C(5))-methyltransferase (FADH(2)-oxidizing) TrmFO [Thermodesulfobacteriota bacterium]